MSEAPKHELHKMLIIPDAKMGEAVAALKHAHILSTGQSTGTSCHNVGPGVDCGDRDLDQPPE
jgi:hypothetical protein